MLDNFLQILPEMIFEAAEKLGGRCTGRFYALNALENRVYEIKMEEGPHVVVKFYRAGRWSRDTAGLPAGLRGLVFLFDVVLWKQSFTFDDQRRALSATVQSTTCCGLG